MDILKDNIRGLYFRYLAAAFGSTLISSIYTTVDMAVVGQSQGPAGVAALAVLAPIWNVMFSLGLLTGIGGAVLFSVLRGGSRGRGRENEYFTGSVFYSLLLALGVWAGLFLFERPILSFFGADEVLMPLAQSYLMPVKCVAPVFIFSQMLAAFLRNDGDPALATWSVVAGGVFNIFGDCFFVFVLDMGMFGAGLATAIGACITFLVLTLHFLKRENTLALVRPARPARRLAEITVTGFPSFFVDVAMGIVTFLFNRQIMRHFGADALAVYSVIINVSTLAQCCAYSVGQASQPVISTNFGAGNGERVRGALGYALATCALLGAFWTIVSLAFPNFYIKVFMTPNELILGIAPGIIRRYALSFILLPFNVFSTYYFQALMKPRAAFAVSILRGLLLSGGLIVLLPSLAGAESLWLAMPVTELFTALCANFIMTRYTRRL